MSQREADRRLVVELVKADVAAIPLDVGLFGAMGVAAQAQCGHGADRRSCAGVLTRMHSDVE